MVASGRGVCSGHVYLNLFIFTFTDVLYMLENVAELPFLLFVYFSVI
jgi:hypothetical protein